MSPPESEYVLEHMQIHDESEGSGESYTQHMHTFEWAAKMPTINLASAKSLFGNVSKVLMP